MSLSKSVLLAMVLAAGFSVASVRAGDDGKKKDPKDMKADEACRAGDKPSGGGR